MNQNLVDCAKNVEAARQKVVDAKAQYRRDGETGPMNVANRALADAHARYREVSDGRIPDGR